MDEDLQDLFKCVVCLDICHECINCRNCNQILCKRHVQELTDDRCPVCRETPFRFRENIALQRIIGEIKSRLGIPDPPPPPPPEAAGVQPRYGRKIPRAGAPGHFQKLPSDEHANAMKEHTRSCDNEKCRSVWRGPWGSFIGGRSGSTHFDLTECAEGKRLNEMIGWDYDNFPG
eukprot:TRINITY_DN108155_c0_g1_i1.p2 TRINITY_DN108155_c0_g1~~TRINITY_DN108155_c0_g1_i1.p2  ORF type:complete len:174 (+),score=35.35 TRINITY_DN108155_c0_g1_i1:87-608(+)